MRYSESVTVNAPGERVWRLLAGVERWPEWNPAMRSVRPIAAPTFAPGASYRVDLDGGRPTSWTVTEVAEGRSFIWESRAAGVRSVAGHELEPGPDGCTKVTLWVEFSGWMARVMGAYLNRVARRNLPREAAGLKAAAEAALD